ncbi:MAG TPA: transposase [Conexibacter sp.]|nr:transposase [Conexibacter sp.]
MATAKVPPRSVAAELRSLLDSPEIRGLVDHLQETRWTGRPGYPIRVMVGMALAKSMYALPTWAKLVRLVCEHDGLQAALGCVGDVPSQWACYRFAKKLRENGEALDACVSRVIAELHRRLPDYGRDIAIDASDMPAYANGQRYLYNHGPERERYSDPDASWGHRSAIATRRGGGFFGYRLHAAVCAKTGLPVAWDVATGKANETLFVADLIDAARARGAAVETMAADRAYDIGRVYEECAERDCQPIVPLRQTPAVKRGDHLPPSCEHGPWRFAGSDYRRGAAKWRCPTGECAPASTWRPASRLHPLIPRETLRWKALYRRRTAVEREFGRLKHEWALLPLRVRGIDRVKLHADLTILAKLATTLERAREVSARRSCRAATTP